MLSGQNVVLWIYSEEKEISGTPMKDDLFNELVNGAKEGGAILWGKKSYTQILVGDYGNKTYSHRS